MNWFFARLNEPSTWRGIIWLLTVAGVSLSPEAWQYITTMGMAGAGLIGVLTSEKAQRVEIQLPPIDLIGVADRTHPVADSGAADQRVQQPVPARSNTVEAADHDANFPGWGS